MLQICDAVTVAQDEFSPLGTLRYTLSYLIRLQKRQFSNNLQLVVTALDAEF